jgi:hypothetical protein
VQVPLALRVGELPGHALEKALRDSEEYIGRMSQAGETLIPNPSIVDTYEVRYLA